MTFRMFFYLFCLSIASSLCFNKLFRFKSQLYSSDFKSSNNFIENITIAYWGQFRVAELNFEAKPSFCVITGQSGSGKSVLISALEHLIKSPKESLSGGRDLFSAFQDISKQTTLSVTKGNVKYDRMYSLDSKKSLCWINGRKSNIKSFNSQIPIRFWYRDSFKYTDIDNKGFLNYVDDIIAFSEESTNEISELFDNWFETYSKIERIKSFDRTSDRKRKEMLELRIQVTEILNIEEKLKELFIDITEALESFVEKELHSKNIKYHNQQNQLTLSPETHTENVWDDDARFEIDELDVETVSQLLYKLYNLLSNHINMKGIDMRKAWLLLSASESILRTLFSASQPVLSPTKSYRSNTATLVGSNHWLDRSAYNRGLDNHPSVTNWKSLIDNIEQCADAITQLQQESIRLGISVNHTILQQLENMQFSLQESKKHINLGRQYIDQISSRWPDIATLLQSIQANKVLMDNFSRKHGISPLEIEKMKRKRVSEIEEYDNLDTTLPRLLDEEKNLRIQYCKLAESRTLIRKRAALDLANSINKLLLDLEMSDKQVLVYHSYLGYQGEENEDNSQLVSLNEYDNHAIESKQIKNIVPVDIMRYGWDQFTLRILPIKSITEIRNISDTLPVTTFSSGEMSRLALALETSYLELKHRSYGNDIDVVGTINEQSTSSRDNTSAMMIFDELDAHIGGEAAVAVAKLLKLQGRFRQIIAVTHSPIIAASADKHFLVWRSISDSTSQVMELTETQREREIARMSTGNTEDLQGLILARKMLNNRLNVS